MKNIRTETAIFKSRGHLILWIHSERDIPPEEFELLLQNHVDGLEPEKARVLVYSHGGGIDAAQRRRLLEATDHAKIRTAVLTDSLVVRGIGTAVGWMNPHLATFSTEQPGKAFDHLQLSDAERQTMTEMLKKGNAELAAAKQAKPRSA